MGKKKATKSRKLRPLLERYIASGEIYCKGRTSRRAFDPITREEVVLPFDAYDITFGGDKENWYFEQREIVSVTARVYDDGSVKYDFFGNTDHMLSREHDRWFIDELMQIITMHRLGAFESERPSLSNISADGFQKIYESKARSKRFKKKLR